MNLKIFSDFFPVYINTNGNKFITKSAMHCLIFILNKNPTRYAVDMNDPSTDSTILQAINLFIEIIYSGTPI